jgi:hypothetical protein
MSIFKPVSFAAALLCLGASAQAQPAAVDIATLTASDAVQQLCAGTVTSEQLVSAYLAQAKAKANLNAFVTLDEAGALKAARAADARARRCLQAAGRRAGGHQGQHPGAGPARHGRHARAQGLRAPPMRPWSRSCARPARSSSARPTCTSWPSASRATTPRSRPAPRSACATPTTRAASRAARRRATARRSARAWRRRRWAPTRAARCAFRARSTAAPRCGPSMGRYSQQGIAPISHTRDTAGPMAQSMADVALLDRVIAGAPR